MAHDEQVTNTSETIESRSRRKAVKTIAGGVTALAAYNLLPVRWEKPIIEQVFLPAHAQTSGEVVEEVPAEEVPAEEVPAEEVPAEEVPAEEPPTSDPISSSPGSLSRTNVADPPDSGDDIYIVFDGLASLTLVAVGDLAPHPPSANAVIGIDTDYDQASVWEHYDNGSNWTVVSTNVTGGFQSPGAYFVIVSGSGPGTTFRIDFDVAVDANLPPTATVSNVTVQPWT